MPNVYEVLTEYTGRQKHRVWQEGRQMCSSLRAARAFVAASERALVRRFGRAFQPRRFWARIVRHTLNSSCGVRIVYESGTPRMRAH
jgi:hypothetical protein